MRAATEALAAGKEWADEHGFRITAGRYYGPTNKLACPVGAALVALDLWPRMTSPDALPSALQVAIIQGVDGGRCDEAYDRAQSIARTWPEVEPQEGGDP